MLKQKTTSKGDTGIGDGWLRLIIPDSHGQYIDKRAEAAALGAAKLIRPNEVVLLGDHVDVSGMYSAHQPNYVKDLEYSYEEDLAAADSFLTKLQKNTPGAKYWYLEGNHEQHAERFWARTVHNAKDAKAMCKREAPARRLHLKERGIRYCRMSEMHDGLSIPGTIKLGKCFFTHGFTASKFATAIHCARFGANIVHGHTHRVQEYGTRTIASDAIGGWCPGTLAQLQPLYRHTSPTEWRHGIGLQMVAKDGRFIHINVPIVKGWCGLEMLIKTIKPQRYRG